MIKIKHIAYAVAFLAAAVAPTTRANAQGYVVVVNAASAKSTLTKSEVSNIFLKKTSGFTPVDQSKSSPVREAFAKAVHGKTSAALDAYWQGQIFSGKDVPPADKSSDADVLAFVRNTPNAIGYVSAGADLGAGVKAVSVP